jgi:Zn-dependent M28 family amino/carboxypeptidase
MKTRISYALFALFVVARIASADAKTDCHLGSYRLENGQTVDIASSDGDTLRWITLAGERGGLRPQADGTWISTFGWTDRPDGKKLSFSACDSGSIEFGGSRGTRIEVDTTNTIFESRGIKLVGRLVMPKGHDKVPIVVLVHGAEHDSAVDSNGLQRLFPAQGIGAFVYDKRGTGSSGGKYTQDFNVLADDAIAALQEAKRLSGDRLARIGYQGASEGGWVVPIAVSRVPVDFAIVSFGLAVTVLEEDRESVELDMKLHHHTAAETAKALELTRAGDYVVETGGKKGYEKFDALRRKYQSEAWYKDVHGDFLFFILPLDKEKIVQAIDEYLGFETPFRYEPMPTLRASTTPQLWILGSDDLDAPSGETSKRIKQLIALGKKYTLAVYPGAEHGMTEYELDDKGERVSTRFAPAYFEMMGDFARAGQIKDHYGDASITKATPAFSLQNLKSDTQMLSSDEFAGRAPLSDGEDKTVAFVTAAMKKAGLSPGISGSYTQSVPLVQTETLKSPAPRFVVAGLSGKQEFVYQHDVTLNTRRSTSDVELKNSEVVFVGYGVNAPEREWNDYAGINVRGKTVLILINDPDWQNPVGKGPFGGAAMTYYGRWTYKYEEAARQGAAAAIIIHNDASAGYPFSVPTSSLGGAIVSLDRKDNDTEPVVVEAWMTHTAAERLVESSGQKLDDLEKAAAVSGFKARSLNVTASFAFQVKMSHGVSKNIMGVLPGKRRADEYLIYTAHWDHLGHCPPDQSGDDICNGAIDNATGVAGLLELARAYKRSPRTDRSVLFMATTGEEDGLLGSEYYATHPAYPLAKTVAEIDIDPLSFMLGCTRDISLVADRTELADVVRRVAALQGRVVTPDSSPEEGNRYRSDTLSFSRAGVPAVVLENGIDVVDQPPGWGKAKLASYIEHHYHQPSDAYDMHWNWCGALQDIALYFGIGEQLANGTTWPNWYTDDEFRAARDRVLKAGDISAHK